VIGIMPAAGAATRLQPLAFSKELLPIAGCRADDGLERPRAVSEFVLERMLTAGADRVCFVLSPRKWDIFHYYSGHPEVRRLCYVTQERPLGLCDALFRAAPLVRADEDVLVGLPDTIWFPAHGYQLLPPGELAFLLFPVDRPERFDAVHCEGGLVGEIEVKAARPRSRWVWGAFRMPARTFRALHDLWREPGRGDEYVGTLVNEYIRRGGRALGVQAGERYFDVGTLEDYRAAMSGLHLPLG
jgi:dTDP-glucose pyrophosphorylase